MNSTENIASEPRSDAVPHLSRSHKRIIEDGIVAISVANWTFIRAWSNLLSGTGRFFDKDPVLRAELLAMALNIVLLGLVVYLGLTAFRRCSSAFWRAVLDFTFLCFLIFPADFIRTAASVTGRDVIWFFKHPVGFLLGATTAGVLIWRHHLAARVTAMVAGVTFPMALFNFGRIALLCLNVTHPHDCLCLASSPKILPVRPGQPRVVWIIFDETDYRLAIEQRPAGVRLPELDRLQQNSLKSDKAYPPGYGTLISMPALVSGRRLLAADISDCQLMVTPDGAGAATDWGTMPSVFSRAREMGVNTALVGWYLPYSRLLARDLNFCSWYSNPLLDPVSASTFSGSIAKQASSLTGIFHLRHQYIEACQGSARDGVSLVADPTYGCILLHLPPPHDPSVYLADKNKFTVLARPVAASYFDNLALADRELGELRRSIETSPLRDNTWVILSADHSWRKSKQYDGKRDYRVPFIVRSPRQEASVSYSRQFNTVLTGDLILAILRGEVTSQPGVAAWLDAHGKPDLPVLKEGDSFE